jgi:hypothetical protein
MKGEIKMNFRYILFVGTLLISISPIVSGQSNKNCFLNDYYPKYTTSPLCVDTIKPTADPTITVTINGSDTLGAVSPYIFGNAVAVWVGQDVNNPTLMEYLQLLSPQIIRYPGGSWSDSFFWGDNPGDYPDSVYVSGAKDKFYPQFGQNRLPSLDSYYNMRDQLGSQGLITVNYAYARYGRSADPVAQAAHYAANWVRYDAGRTEFWEIGNENAGIWEYGYQIDTSINLDGQPAIITGQLYGKHFKVFADSMKAAAAEIGTTIFIGGQVIQEASAATGVGAAWNTGFFSEVGDAVDFYVAHDYFGNNSTNVKGQISIARTEIVSDINYIRADVVGKGAYSKPIAFTEWNCNGPDAAKISIANGLQAVILFCEMLNNNVGTSCRWLIANWDADGMFYFNTNPVYPLWNPRPDFYYIYYLQHFIGDHMISTTLPNPPVSGSSDIIAYASRFTSGHTGVVIINQNSTTGRVLNLVPKDIGVGNRYYVYSLTGTGSNTTFPESVVVNSADPTGSAWGPLDGLTDIQARAYPVGDTIKITSPARSVQFVLIDDGSRYLLTGVEENSKDLPKQFGLEQNYPNPFNPQTTISFSLPKMNTVTLKIYDVIGREVAVLVNNEKKKAGAYSVSFDGTKFPSGVYFYKLISENFNESKKMLLIK